MYFAKSLSVILLAIFVCFLRAGYAVAQKVDPTLIALFGDSITTGYNEDCKKDNANGVSSDSDNCPRLDLYVQMAGPPKRSVILSNWGEGGTSSERGADRIRDDLDENTDWYSANGCSLGGSGDTCYVLILYGTNDDSHGISPSTTGFNTELMIDRAEDEGYTPIIGTLLPRSDKSVSPYNAQIESAANSEGVFVVDLYDRFVNDSSGDYKNLLERDDGRYLHPNESGYLVIAQTWFDERLEDIIDPDPPMVISPVLFLLLGD